MRDRTPYNCGQYHSYFLLTLLTLKLLELEVLSSKRPIVSFCMRPISTFKFSRWLDYQFVLFMYNQYCHLPDRIGYRKFTGTILVLDTHHCCISNSTCVLISKGQIIGAINKRFVVLCLIQLLFYSRLEFLIDSLWPSSRKKSNSTIFLVFLEHMLSFPQKMFLITQNPFIKTFLHGLKIQSFLILP